MSKLMDLLRSVRVFNDYEFFQNEPYLWLRVEDYRSVLPSRWCVSKRNAKLSDSHWDYGDMTFSYFGKQSKAAKFEEAKAYMKEHFGISELKRAPTGGWGDAEYVDRRLKELKEMAKRRVENGS